VSIDRRGRFLFDGLSLEGMRVLEVGSGDGALAVWVVQHGAVRVVALEPELDGSTAGSSNALEAARERLELGDRVELHRVPLAQFDSTEAFDVAILNGVVNHLNEAAVVRLHRDPSAVDEFVETLRPLRALMRPGAMAVVTDVGRRSIWRLLGVEGPWTKHIEWHKHQQPHTWIEVFRRVGFEPYDVRWTPLRDTGRLTGNRVVQFFTLAHFVLRLRAV
jgi:cyclopropane fatty-acyl-phospholipid synthase-like methyltransferase